MTNRLIAGDLKTRKGTEQDTNMVHSIALDPGTTRLAADTTQSRHVIMDILDMVALAQIAILRTKMLKMTTSLPIMQHH